MAEFFNFVDKDNDRITVRSGEADFDSVLVGINDQNNKLNMAYLPKKQVKQLRKELKLWLKGQ